MFVQNEGVGELELGIEVVEEGKVGFGGEGSEGGDALGLGLVLR